jgi:hypothetical protein
MRGPLATVLLLAMIGGSLTACRSATADQQSACDAAFAQALAIEPGSDTISSFDGAISGCESLEAWVSAAEQFPDAFGGEDPTDLARQRCAANPALANTPVCAELLASDSGFLLPTG